MHFPGVCLLIVLPLPCLSTFIHTLNFYPTSRSFPVMVFTFSMLFFPSLSLSLFLVFLDWCKEYRKGKCSDVALSTSKDRTHVHRWLFFLSYRSDFHFQLCIFRQVYWPVRVMVDFGVNLYHFLSPCLLPPNPLQSVPISPKWLRLISSAECLVLSALLPHWCVPVLVVFFLSYYSALSSWPYGLDLGILHYLIFLIFQVSRVPESANSSQTNVPRFSFRLSN